MYESKALYNTKAGKKSTINGAKQGSQKGYKYLRLIRNWRNKQKQSYKQLKFTIMKRTMFFLVFGMLVLNAQAKI